MTSRRETTPERIRSWIYVAADDEAAVLAAFDSDVDAVILDLEDLVPLPSKASARIAATGWIERRAGHPWPRLFVRINHPTIGVLDEDLDVVVRAGVAGIRYPKADDPAEIARVDERLTKLEAERGLAPGAIRIVANIESAAGVLRASEVLAASERIDQLGFGEADLSRDLKARVGPHKDETFVARSLLVLASAAVGRSSPCDGVHLDRSDHAGLEATTRRGRDLGFFGRTSIDLRQVPIINAIYTPDPDQVAWARAVVELQAQVEREGRGSGWLPDGRFVDIAVARAAEDVIADDAAFRARRSTGAPA
jgi:citrate lyase subunit beta/citryl-CoA lyase